jgi:fructose-1,6-bisphosphatase/inositol monophosphatase family enzyme
MMRSFNQLADKIQSLLISEDVKLKKTIKVKSKNEKDLVTKLDIKIQDLIIQYYRYSDYKVISEEDFNHHKFNKIKNKLIITDPLDGTINFKLGLPFFCSQWAFMEKQKLKSAFFVSSNEKKKCNLSYKKYSIKEVNKIKKPIYLALGSGSQIKFKKLTMNIIEIINQKSPGFYRWGSAGFALKELSNNKLGGFVGLNCKFWDIIPILPFLVINNYPIYYKWTNDKFSICISYDKSFNKIITKIFANHRIKLMKLGKDLKLKHEKL